MSRQLAPLNAGLERMRRKLSLLSIESGDVLLEQLEVLRSTAFEFGDGLHGAASSAATSAAASVLWLMPANDLPEPVPSLTRHP